MREEIKTPYNHNADEPSDFAGIDLESMELRSKAIEQRMETANEGLGMKVSEIMEEFENNFSKRELSYMAVMLLADDEEGQTLDGFLNELLN